MSERAADPRKFIAPALMGAYAAAIALAPRPEIAVAIAAPLVVVPLIYWAILKRDQWLEIFFAAALLLPPLPFGFGNSGPHAALLVAGLGILAGLFRLGDWRVPFTPLGRAFGIFFLILMGTSTVAYFYSGAAVALAEEARRDGSSSCHHRRRGSMRRQQQKGLFCCHSRQRHHNWRIHHYCDGQLRHGDPRNHHGHTERAVANPDSQ